MRIMIRPAIDQQREIDLTQRLIAAIAEELWQRYGGNEQLNWLEAEAHLKRLVGQVQVEAGVNVADQSVTGMGADEPTIALEPRRRREVSGLDNIASCARAAQPARRLDASNALDAVLVEGATGARTGGT